jgi:hypothetical protein
MQAYVEGEDGCRRKISGAYLDGDKERGRCRADEEACDLCRPDESVGEQGDGHNEQATENDNRGREDEGVRDEVARQLQEQLPCKRDKRQWCE